MEVNNSHIEILLVQPAYGTEVEKRIFQPGIELPYNLTCLSGYLEKEGISSDIFDWRLHNNPVDVYVDKLNQLKPQIVGITSVTSGIENAARIAKITKQVNNNILTIIGGCHASALPQETLTKCTNFDYLVHGEGEIVLTNFVRAIHSNENDVENLKGLAFRKVNDIIVNPRENQILDLNQLPLPARDKIDLYRYVPKSATRNYRRLPTTGLSVSRGCPYNCLFCYKGVWGKSIRFRSREHVIAEIEHCIREYGIYDFRFYDDVLTYPKWDTIGFCDEIINKKLDITWSCWSRVNDVNYDLLAKMKKAGCYHIKYGIEFGTEKALKLSKKGSTLEQARRAIKLTKEVGIECKGSFICGIPGETFEDCEKTIEFALEISPDFATFYPYDCIPGSKFYEQINNGTTNGPLLSKDVTKKLASQAYKRFYFRFTFVFQRLKAMIASPKREIVALLSGLKMMTIFFTRKGN